MDWARYAIYWLPGGTLGRAGADWLGWDARAGAAVPGADPATESPRRYGFHATIKPPFRLAEGTAPDDLRAGLRTLAATLAPVDLGRLEVKRLGGFLALTPEYQPTDLAARVVADLDAFRRPAGVEELAKRRAPGLTPAQDALLMRWGYPYVMDAFRMHLTLTERDASAEIEARARATFAPLAGPWRLDTLSLVGEDAVGRFHLLEDVTLDTHRASADRAAPTA